MVAGALSPWVRSASMWGDGQEVGEAARQAAAAQSRRRKRNAAICTVSNLKMSFNHFVIN